LTQEQTFLLNLLQAGINGQPPALPQADIDWEKLLQEAVQQAVPVLAWESLQSAQKQVPAQVYALWSQVAMGKLATNLQAGYAQSQLVKLLEGHNVAYCILKGEASASYYPKPELRVLGDVDFLIEPDKLQEVGDLLVEAGFTRSHEGHERHQVFRRQREHLEMHFEIAGIPGTEQGAQIRAFLEPVLQTCQQADVGSGGFLMPSDLFQGVVLLLHMQHHMLDQGLGLRHLCDWACYVNKTADKPFWETQLLPLFRKIGLLTYAQVMTGTCVTYLGIDSPDWLTEVDTSLCQAVIEDILTGGNFGRKDTARAKSGMLIEQGENGNRGVVYHLHRAAKDTVKQQHPRAAKWQYPVYYAALALRYIGRVAKGQRAGLGALSAKAEERKSVYERLHIFEVEL